MENELSLKIHQTMNGVTTIKKIMRNHGGVFMERYISEEIVLPLVNI